MTITLRITLVKPPAGIDFGLQKGLGSNYQLLSEVYKLRTTMPGVSDSRHSSFVDRVYEQHCYKWMKTPINKTVSFGLRTSGLPIFPHYSLIIR